MAQSPNTVTARLRKFFSGLTNNRSTSKRRGPPFPEPDSDLDPPRGSAISTTLREPRRQSFPLGPGDALPQRARVTRRSSVDPGGVGSVNTRVFPEDDTRGRPKRRLERSTRSTVPADGNLRRPNARPNALFVDIPSRPIRLDRLPRSTWSPTDASAKPTLRSIGSPRQSPTTSELRQTVSRVRGERVRPRDSFLHLLFMVLDFPRFNEVIHWDEATETKVVLEKPQILELYILMPVFGFPTLDTFKRRLWASGFDYVPYTTLGGNADTEVAAWRHFTMRKSNPPMGSISRDWSEETGTCESVAPSKGIRSPVPTPTPTSRDGGRTLDWSQPPIRLSSSLASFEPNLAIQHDRRLSTIRLSVPPETLEKASKVAVDLRKRYDLIFLRIGTPTPVRLTTVTRWAVSTSKVPPNAWKKPVPTSMIEEYLAENVNANSANSNPRAQISDWWVVVDEFIFMCDELGQTRELHRSELPFAGDRGQKRASSRASSRTSSRSEGHVSPDDDPGRKERYSSRPNEVMG